MVAWFIQAVRWHQHAQDMFGGVFIMAHIVVEGLRATWRERETGWMPFAQASSKSITCLPDVSQQKLWIFSSVHTLAAPLIPKEFSTWIPLSTFCCHVKKSKMNFHTSIYSRTPEQAYLSYKYTLTPRKPRPIWKKPNVHRWMPAGSSFKLQEIHLRWEILATNTQSWVSTTTTE